MAPLPLSQGSDLIVWRRRRRRQRDEAVEAAKAEQIRSEVRLEHMRHTIVGPMTKRGQVNKFAETIRQSLNGG